MLTFLQNAANTAHARRYHAKQRIANDFVNDARLDGLTLSRSAGSIYYFNSSGVLTSTGDNVAAFTSNGLFIEGQATNLVAAANYRDFSTWTLANVTMKATTPTLIDGTTGTSAKNEILESATTTEHSALIAWTAATAAKQSVMIAVKRGTGTRHVQVRIHNATDLYYGSVTYNLDTLATIGTVTADYTTAYVKGAYTIIELVDTNVTTGAQSLVVNMHDGTSNSYLGDATSTLILDWAQVCLGGRSESHVQGDATRYTSFISRPWIGAVNNLWAYIDLNAKAVSTLIGSTSLRILTIYRDANSYVRVRVTSTSQLIAESFNAGAGLQTITIAAFAYTKNDRLRIVVSYDSANGLRLRGTVNGTPFSGAVSTQKENISAFTSSTNLYLASFDGSNTGFVYPCEIRNYKIGTGILSGSQQAELVGG